MASPASRGDPLGSQECSVSLPVVSHLQEEAQPCSWSRTSQSLYPGSAPGSAWGRPLVLICATAAGVQGQPRGQQVPSALAHGRVLLVPGCCWCLGAVQPPLGQQGSTARQLGFILAFLGGISHRVCLVPLESRHCPQVIFLLKHSRKVRGFERLKSCFKLGYLQTKIEC